MTNYEKEDLRLEIEEASSNLGEAKQKFLRKTGWDYSCDHPDYCWRWSKEIRGKNYSLGPDQAISMELRIQEAT